MVHALKIPVVAVLFSTQAALALTPLSMLGPSPAFPDSMSVGSSQTFSYSLTNNTPKTAPLTVLAFTNPAVVRTSLNCTNDCGSTLPAGLSCNLCIQITPNAQDFTTGKILQSLVVDYTGRAPLEATIFIKTITAALPVAGLAGPVPPITNMNVGDLQDVLYTVINAGTVPTSPIRISGLSAPVSLQDDTCSGQALPPTGICTFDVDIAPTQPGQIDQTLSVNYGGTSPLTSPIQLTVSPQPPTGVSVGAPFPMRQEKPQGTGGLIFQTVDGSWSAVTPSGQGPLQSVTNNGAGVFVGVGSSNAIIFSENGGVTWAPSTITPTPPLSLNFTSVAFNSNNNTFVAIAQPTSGTGAHSLYYSTDGGKNWAPSNPLPIPPPPRSVLPSAAPSSTVPPSVALSSTMLPSVSSPPSLVLFDRVHLLFDAFVNDSDACSFYHSTDGITWTLGNNASNTTIRAATTDTAKVLAVGHTQNTPIAGEVCTSNDGLVFSCSEPTGVPNDWSGLSFATLGMGPLYVSTTSSGHIWTSTDGVSGWTDQGALSSLLNAVTYGPFLGSFYAVGATADLTAAMYTSSNGTTWTAVPLLPFPPGVFPGMLTAVSIE